MPANEHHEVIRKSGVLDVEVLAPTRDCPRALQHFVDLVEIKVRQERGNHPTLRNAPFAAGFEDQLQQSHHLRVIHPLGDFTQDDRVRHRVEVALEIEIDDTGQTHQNCFTHPRHCLMRSALWTIPIRPILEIRFEDRLQDQFQGTLNHTIPDRRNAEDADPAASLRDLHFAVSHRTVLP